MVILVLIRTLISYFLVGIVGAICIVPCFIIACLPSAWRRDNKIYYWFVSLFYRSVVKFSFLPVTFKGLNHIPHEPSIFIANHQSALDIPFFGSVVDGHPHIWMFVKKYAQVPVFGFIARRMNVVVDSSGLRKLVGSLHDSLNLIKGHDRHLMLFPEGGRYLNGSVQKFFYGFAMIAKETRRPVVPVVMLNLNKVYPPGSFLVNYYPVTILVGTPFVFQDTETEDQFLHRVHAWFVQHTTVE